MTIPYDEPTPRTLCPDCGYAYDRIANVTIARPPIPGSLLLCISCGGLREYDAQLRPVPFPDEKLSTLGAATRAEVIVARAAIRAHGPRKQRGAQA